MTNPIKRLISMGLLLLVALSMTLGAHVETQAARLRAPWTNGQAADGVLGQPDFVSGLPDTTASLAFNPHHVAVDPTSGKIFMADRGNHRVLRFSAGATDGAAAEAVLGQADFTSGSSNRGGTVMANTLSFPSRVFVDAAGRLWVADSNNNRVLRFDNAASKATGAAADGVLGQANFTTDTAGVTSPSSIGFPSGVFVDSGGRLWVAAENERRVLRFDNAAAKANGANADGVLGQANFTDNAAATSQNGLDAPTDVHVDAAGRLWVADSFNQRVLRFDNAAAKANGANANGVLGQTNFTANTSGTSQSKFNFTDGSLFVGVGITTDAEGRLYVGDRFNNRIMIFNDAATKVDGGNADNVLGQTDFTSNTANTGGRSATSLNAPTGVFFDLGDKQLWAADRNNNRVLRYVFPGGPEIEVLDGATDIPDNTGSVNFGPTTVGTPVTKQFTVQNTGGEDLTLSGLTVPAGFSIASNFAAATVAAGGQTSFSLQLEATAVGAPSGAVQFTTNDADENPFNFSVTGSVQAPPPPNTWFPAGPDVSSVTALAIHPITPTTLYAGTLGSGVFKSTNGGAAWTSVSSLNYVDVTALAIHPTTPETLYAGARGGGVLKSTDGGTSWTAANTGLTNIDVTALAIHPTTPETLYAGTLGGGVFKSTNGGTSWTAVNTGLTNLSVISLAVDPTNPNILYAGTTLGGSLFKSTNAGATWSDAGLPIITDVHAVVIDPTNSNVIYAGTGEAPFGGGVFKSTNGGATWSAVNTGLTTIDVRTLALDPTTPTTLYAGTFDGGVFKSTNGGTAWSVVNTGLPPNLNVNVLAVDPTTPTTLYTGAFGGGVFKSTNGGTAWTAADTGLTIPAVTTLTIHPTTPETLYAGAFGNGVFKSTTGGASWAEVNTGLTTTAVLALAIHPTTPETLYAGTSGGGGVFKSTNGGAAWTAADTGLPDMVNIGALAIHPTTPETLYAGIFGGGVFKTTNGGTSWTVMNTGLTDTDVLALAINPTTPETLYAGTFGGGVFKSTNGGASWTFLSACSACFDISAVAVDPKNSNTVYVSTNNGVFKSTDGGSSWSQTGSASTGGALVINPTNTDIIYASGTFVRGGVSKSTNGGTTWTAINNGLTDLDVPALAINPTHPNILYAGTRGGVFKIIQAPSDIYLPIVIK